MTPDDFRAEVIDPVLRLLDLYSRAASNLMLGTALVESRLVHRRQIGGGPARGLFQIEPATFHDVYRRYLPRRTGLLMRVNGLLLPNRTPAEQLYDNDRLGCAIARLKYWMCPLPLPRADDAPGLAAYWVRHYNAGGAGTVEKFLAAYKEK